MRTRFTRSNPATPTEPARRNSGGSGVSSVPWATILTTSAVTAVVTFAAVEFARPFIKKVRDKTVGGEEDETQVNPMASMMSLPMFWTGNPMTMPGPTKGRAAPHHPMMDYMQPPALPPAQPVVVQQQGPSADTMMSLLESQIRANAEKDAQIRELRDSLEHQERMMQQPAYDPRASLMGDMDYDA